MRWGTCIVALALFSCAKDSQSGDPDGGLPPGSTSLTFRPTGALDVLLVVDNTNSMSYEQSVLSQSMNALQNVLGGLDLHIGVTTTDLGGSPIEGDPCFGDGDDGLLLTNQDCGLDLDAHFLVDTDTNHDGVREFNYDTTLGLAETVGCMALVGEGGCAFAQPLAAAHRALTHPDNGGFLRDEAHLAVLFITDGDDCSTTERPSDLLGLDEAFGEGLGPRTLYRCFAEGVVCDPDDPYVAGPRCSGDSCSTTCVSREDSAYVASIAGQAAAIRAIKQDPSMVRIAGLFGPPTLVEATLFDEPAQQLRLQPSCGCESQACIDQAGVPSPLLLSISDQPAAPGIRLSAFMAEFSEGARTSPICTDDFQPALSDFGAHWKHSLGATCLRGELVDVNQTADGLQPDCRVSEGGGFLPTCVATPNERCFAIVASDACADTSSGLAIEVRQDGEPSQLESDAEVTCTVLE